MTEGDDVKEMPNTPTAEQLAAVVRERFAERNAAGNAARIRAASDPTLRWFVPRWRWQITLSWTNWTFGVYWGKVGKKYMVGIDFGPLEIVRVREFVRSERAKHQRRA